MHVQSEERGTPSRRSKSEGPYRIPNGDAYPIGDTVDKPNGHPKTGSKVRQWFIPMWKIASNYIHHMCIPFKMKFFDESRLIQAYMHMQ